MKRVRASASKRAHPRLVGNAQTVAVVAPAAAVAAYMPPALEIAAAMEKFRLALI